MKKTERPKAEKSQKQTKPRIRSAPVKKTAGQRLNTKTGLPASEEKFRRLFETAQDGILLLEAETGVITEANPFIENLLGYSHEELVGKKIWDIGPFKDVSASKYSFRKLQAKKYIRYEDLPLETKGGSRREVEFVSNVYRVGGQKVVQCNIRDITDRKRAEEKSRHLAAIVESSEDAVIGKTLDGIIISWNKSAEKTYGYTEAEAIGQPISILIPPGREDEVPRILEKIKRGEHVKHYETERRRKDGQLITMSLAVSPVKDADGKIVSASVAARDITERKRIEESLHLSEEQFRLVSYAINDAVWDWNLANNQVWWNQNVKRLFGFSDEEVKPDIGWLEERVHPDDRDKVMRSIRKAIDNGEEFWSKEFRFRRADGIYARTFGRGYIVHDHHGQPVRLLGALMDITQWRRVEADLEKSEVRYRELFENAVLAAFQSTQDGKVLAVNSEFARMFGYMSPEKFMADIKNAADIFADPKRRAEIVRLRLKNPALTTFENLYRRKDGSTFIGLLHVRTVTDSDDRSLYFEGFIEDITERKRSEEALAQSEEHYRALFETSLEGIGLSKGNQIIDANRALLDIFGYEDKKEFLNKPLLEHVAPESRGLIRDRQKKRAEGKPADQRFEYKIVRKNGEIRDLEISTTSINIKNEMCTLSTFRDITERKQAEEQIRQRNMELAALNRIGQAFSRLAPPSEIVELLYTNVGQMLDNRNLYIALYDETDHSISFPLYTVNGERRESGSRPFGNGLTEYVVRTKAPLLIPNDQPAFLAKNGIDLIGTPSRCFLAATMQVGERVLGVIAVQDYEKENAYNAGHMELLATLAAQAAIALENSRLYSAVQQELDERNRVEAALSESGERFREIFENMSSGVVVYEAIDGGKDFRINNFNRAAERIEKVARESVIGKAVSEVFPGVRDMGLFVVFLRVWKTGKPEHYPAALYQDEREAGWRENYIARLPSGEIVVVYDDVTERKQAEREIQSLSKFPEENPYPVFRIGSDGFLQYANQAGAPLLAMWNIHIGQAMPAEWQAWSKEAFDSGHNKEVEVTCGETIFSLILAPVVEAEYVNIYGRDITKRKQAEQALRESEGRFRGAVEAAGAVPYFFSYASQTYSFMGEGILALTGYSAREMTPSLFKSLVQERYMVGKEAQVPPEEAAQRMRAGKITNWRCDNLILARDGRTRWVADASVAVFDEKGKVIGSIGFLQDITERKQVEETLARQTEELNRRNKELNRLYRASVSLISSSPFDLQTLAQTITDVILEEFGQSNCSVFLVPEESKDLDRIAAAGPYTEQVSRKVLTLDGAGLVPQAIRSGKVINTPDVHKIPAYIPSWEAARSELTIPLKIGSQVIGAIDVQSAEPDFFSADDERLMSIFAERAALALEHTRLFAKTERRMQNLASMRTIDSAISNSFNLDITLDILLDQVTKQLGVDATDILVFNVVTQMFQYAAGQGFRTQALQHTNIRLGDGYAGRAARERRTVVIQNLENNLAGFQRSSYFPQEGFTSYIGIPLTAKGQIKGVLEIFNRKLFGLDREENDFLEMLAGQAAIAIDNVELFEKLQGSNAELMMAYDETIEGWSRAMDLRDQETEGHTQRVSAITLKLANYMGFNTDEMVHIRRGALLHDIGKMGVPDSILRKPGPLTEEEWEIMQKHPHFAYEMLAPIAYLRTALDIPYCHHEKWDGTGYPRKLKEEQIPLAARIFAIVDVWDALMSDRPYRKAWPEDKVRTHIREQSGKHFDPRVTDIFLREVLDVNAR